ncbi:glycosyltransferase [Christiangramia portivictoriae]|uniref:glycosyltransferase n=1 Tax=Christiangramia portivictoriae TaxID=326069 RepID=UPI0003F6B412|nr:glycosyltransferase [Christiangramia portivictoriae]
MEKLYSIVIPVFKSAQSLEILISKLEHISRDYKYRLEVIFVNDSPLELSTVATLEKVRKNYTYVKVLTLYKNQGQQIATLAGMSQATGDFVITMDDDLQHSPDDIPLLIQTLQDKKNLDGVFAVPNYLQKKHKLWRNFASFFLKKVDTIFLKKPKGLMLSSFRILTKDLNKLIVENHNAMPSVSSLILNATNNLISIHVKHHQRGFDKSNYSLPQLITLALNTILHYSSIPLRIMAFVGLLGFIGSMIFILSIIIRKLMLDIEIPGYASIVTLISFFGGLNLFALGLIGEYLIRVIKEQQKMKLPDLIKS